MNRNLKELAKKALYPPEIEGTEAQVSINKRRRGIFFLGTLLTCVVTIWKLPEFGVAEDFMTGLISSLVGGTLLLFISELLKQIIK